jgi:hypothetical protein
MSSAAEALRASRSRAPLRIMHPNTTVPLVPSGMKP